MLKNPEHRAWIAAVDARAPGCVLLNARPSFALDGADINDRGSWQFDTWVVEDLLQKIPILGVFPGLA